MCKTHQGQLIAECEDGSNLYQCVECGEILEIQGYVPSRLDVRPDEGMREDEYRTYITVKRDEQP